LGALLQARPLPQAAVDASLRRYGGPSHHTMVATTTAAALAATTIHSTAAARISTTAPTIPALTDEGPAGAQVESHRAAPQHRLSSPAPRSTAGELYCFAVTAQPTVRPVRRSRVLGVSLRSGTAGLAEVRL